MDVSAASVLGNGHIEKKRTIYITAEKLDHGSITECVRDDAAGAISTFIGTTRNHFNNKHVIELIYEAYESMAIKELDRVAQSTVDKYPGVMHMALVHRIGLVPVGEASVIIAVSSAHRRDAIEACWFAIDELKAKVPIWKREVYADGSEWKENVEGAEGTPHPFRRHDCCSGPRDSHSHSHAH